MTDDVCGKPVLEPGGCCRIEAQRDQAEEGEDKSHARYAEGYEERDSSEYGAHADRLPF
ncbi:hypothetical protein [Methanogenium cariaci]|uniref:hypothetical protein n=1 Tax=Methanogenium cariaci TaxID=2197 RepID=UPI001FE0E3ED|nr:hypothetical protein [Methanogenium cariaci]